MDREKQATSLTAAMETREGKGDRREHTQQPARKPWLVRLFSTTCETMSSKDRCNQKFKPSSVGHAALLKFSQKFPILAVLENNYLDQREKHFQYHLVRNVLILQMSNRNLGQNHKMPKKETDQKHLVTLETQRRDRQSSNSHLRDAWRARFRWPWGLLQQASARWASPRCAWARPAARPARAGTAPGLEGRPPACAADRGEEEDQPTCPAGQTAHVYQTPVSKWLLRAAQAYRQSNEANHTHPPIF